MFSAFEYHTNPYVEEKWQKMEDLCHKFIRDSQVAFESGLFVNDLLKDAGEVNSQYQEDYLKNVSKLVESVANIGAPLDFTPLHTMANSTYESNINYLTSMFALGVKTGKACADAVNANLRHVNSRAKAACGLSEV